MKIISFFLLIALTIMTTTATAKTWYVQTGETGKATSWEDASGDLYAVMFAAEAGDEIWVAGGTYFPTKTYNRSQSFVLSSGVKMFGGFAGNETKVTQRDWKTNTTILSGNIGQDHFKNNSYTIVRMKNANSQTVLDGFILEEGNANGASAPRHPNKCGGALYIDGSNGGESTPQIVNCTFRNNYGRDGGAVYNNGTGGVASPLFINCVFEDNRADLDGGAVFNDGRRDGESNTVFENCEFDSNEANYGGAMINYGGAGESNVIANDCVFIDNESYTRESNIYNMDVEGKAGLEKNVEGYATTDEDEE